MPEKKINLTSKNLNSEGTKKGANKLVSKDLNSVAGGTMEMSRKLNR